MLRSLSTVSVLVLSATLSFAADKDQSGSLTPADAKFVKEAAVGAMTEVELGHLAVQNGSNPDVKQFGQRMVTDHGKELSELKSLAQAKGIDLPMELDKKHKEDVEKLSKLSGADFDKAYSKDMLKDHRKDVKEFKKEAEQATDPDVKAFAAKEVPMLEEHLSMAEKLPGNTSPHDITGHEPNAK